MGNIRQLIKSRVEKSIPYSIGSCLKHVPYSLKLWPEYGKTRHFIKDFQSFSIPAQKDFIFSKVLEIMTFAARATEFYRSYYREKNCEISSFETFSQLSKVPLTSKAILKDFSLASRSVESPGRLLINTGGTSGQPLEFHIDRHAFSRHFAHYHTTWARLGYTPKDLKLTFRGKNLSKSPLHYNPVHHEFYVNAYIDYERICDAIIKIVKQVRWIHGYPSAIYEFVRFCSNERPEVLDALRQQVKGIFFDSEYPAPIYRDFIEENLTRNTLASYGHSEMALMAFEVEKNVYSPYHSFGYCEAVPSGSSHSLVGTSYFNIASPFIRYDTGDLINPLEEQEGLLNAFEIAEGRVGDFIEDRYGKNISLTALLFGRHHQGFNFFDFIQIRQAERGKAEFILTHSSPETINNPESFFDLSNVDVEFYFTIVSKPIRTNAGKLPLLVR